VRAIGLSAIGCRDRHPDWPRLQQAGWVPSSDTKLRRRFGGPIERLPRSQRGSRLSSVGRAPRSSSIVVGLLLGASLVLALLAERRNTVFPLIDLATGCSLIVAGCLTIQAARERLAGALLLAAAASWFVATADLAGGLTDRVTWVHRALLVQALLVTSARVTAVRVAVIVVAYAGSIDQSRAVSTQWLAVIGGATIAMLVADVVRRESTWHFATPASIGVLLWTAAVGFFLPHDMFDPRVRSALYAIGIGLAAFAVAASTTRLVVGGIAPTTADIVRDGGPADLRVGFRSADRTEFDDVGGQAFVRLPGEATTRILLGGDLGEAIVAMPTAAVDLARARDELTEGLRLLAANNRALQVTRSQAIEVAASEQRIREADDSATSQIGFELDRLVVQRIDEALDLVGEHPSDAASAARDALVEVRSEVQALAAGLSPAALDGGLRAALTSLSDHQPMPVDARLVDVRVDSRVARALYFAAAECLTNAIRHASASRLQMTLQERGTDAELTVTDNGCGGAQFAPGGGLTGLAARLESLGGGLVLRAGGEGGTEIVVHLPLAISHP
jgi:signal transduction histidine kinase